MLPVQISYPAFEANQVLSNGHLNQLFTYLDEQERLSRTNLIGIGIVCGLEPRLAENGSSLRISKGCGITSEGYLIVWPDTVELEWYRPYAVPENLPYSEFEYRSGGTPRPFPLWELKPDRNNDSEAVRLTHDFLRGTNQPSGSNGQKILVLFLEQLAVRNRNCIPNSCSDKGTTVTSTVRPLLVRLQDMNLLLDRIRSLGPETASYFKLNESLGSRLALPTLKLPRFDVAATVLNTTESVFDAFQRVLSQSLVQNISNALSATYDAFHPLLPDFTANPFTLLNTQWAFLYDGSIESSNRYLWYQYYFDHLDTIIQAYDEFRHRSLEVVGLCCPDSRLFPRHLILANLGDDPPEYEYRNTFVPSSIFTRQLGALNELRQLFKRLVQLVQGLELPPDIGQSYTNSETGYANAYRQRLRAKIKITPSKLAAPLSEKAIPYHYNPSIHLNWNYQLSRKGKAIENLGYRSSAWNTTDDAVRYPLNFELEPFNFLRVEGHVGQNFAPVMEELLSQRNHFRLPIDIVALKTGRNANSIPLPETAEGCHFQDLEVLYDSLRKEFLCRICEIVMRLYNTPIWVNDDQTGNQTFIPNLPFLRQCAPNFRYLENTVGQRYENSLNRHTNLGPFFWNVPISYWQHISYIFHLVRLAESLAATLPDLNFNTLRSFYSSLFEIVRNRNDTILSRTNDENDSASSPLPRMDLKKISEQLEMFFISCKIKPIQSVWEEYQLRLQKVRESLLLSNFTRKHTGLTHKAGVPLGGTLVLVYHGENQQDEIPAYTGRFELRGQITDGRDPLPGANIHVKGTAQGTITDMDGNFNMVVNVLPVELRISFIGYDTREILVTNPVYFLNIDLNEPDSTDTTDRFGELAAGTVISDFYLPYLCCSDCHPIQFVLPKAQPTFSWEQIGCTDSDSRGTISIIPNEGTSPYEVSIDGGLTWSELGEEMISVNNGAAVIIRDAEGVESTSRTIQLIPQLTVRTEKPICDEDGNSFTVELFISGGRPPYQIVQGEQIIEVPANSSSKPKFVSGQGANLVIKDSSTPPCQESLSIPAHQCEEDCKLPCDGIMMECGHPFWMQRNASNQWQYQEVQLRVVNFFVQGETPTQSVSFNRDQLSKLTDILNPNTEFNSASSFSRFWNESIPRANEYIQIELQEVFGSEIGTILSLSYKPDTVDRFTTLWIETYECFQFHLELDLHYFGNTENLRFNRKWRYSNKGSEVNEEVNYYSKIFNSTAGIPPFNCTQKNRCHPQSEPIALCKKPFEVGIIPEPFSGNRHSLIVQPEEIVANSAVLWDVQQGVPGISSEQSFNVETSILYESVYLARVLVVNPETGCAASAEINLKNDR
jgi:hypothetical protein